MVAHNDTIAVWFSCGAPSAAAAKLTADLYGSTCNVRILNTPVAEEDADNHRFLLDVQDWIGIEIEQVINPRWPNSSAIEVWEKRQFMSSPFGAPCTKELKKKARQIWEKENNPNWHVLGFAADEKNRHDRFVMTERDNVLPILIDAKLTKPECLQMVLEAGIKLPKTYAQGYPNANCKGCVKATSPTYWNHVRKVDPDIFYERANQSKALGARLVKVEGERIFLHELDPNAEGNPMKNMDFECGIFCMET